MHSNFSTNKMREDYDAVITAAESLGARMLLQVHDELLFEVPLAEVDAVRTLVVNKMEGALALDVPLVAEVATGVNWLETK